MSLHRQPTDTEIDAYHSVLPHMNAMRTEILKSLRELKGATGSEISDVTAIWLYTAKPRLTELNQMGLINDTQERRKNKRRQNEIVWNITPKGEEVLNYMSLEGANDNG